MCGTHTLRVQLSHFTCAGKRKFIIHEAAHTPACGQALAQSTKLVCGPALGSGWAGLWHSDNAQDTILDQGISGHLSNFFTRNYLLIRWSCSTVGGEDSQSQCHHHDQRLSMIGMADENSLSHPRSAVECCMGPFKRKAPVFKYDKMWSAYYISKSCLLWARHFSGPWEWGWEQETHDFCSHSAHVAVGET